MAVLSPEPARRARRLLAAARAKRAAGALDAALELLIAVEASAPDPLRTAEVERLRGLIAFVQRRASVGAQLLLSAASTPGHSCASPMTCWTPWGSRGSPSGPGASCWPPVRTARKRTIPPRGELTA